MSSSSSISSPSSQRDNHNKRNTYMPTTTTTSYRNVLSSLGLPALYFLFFLHAFFNLSKIFVAETQTHHGFLILDGSTQKQGCPEEEKDNNLNTPHQFMKHINAQEATTGTPPQIPLQLLQTAKTHDMPRPVQALHQEWYDKNPSMEHYIMDDDQMWLFVEHYYNKTVLEAMHQVAVPVVRADMARLMFMYQYGGIYADTDVGPRRPVSEILQGDDKNNNHHCEFYAEVMQGKLSLSQCAFVAKPKSPIVKFILDTALQNLLLEHTNPHKNVSDATYVLKLAGPMSFTESLIHYINQNYQTNFEYYPDASKFNLPQFVKQEGGWLRKKANICLSVKHDFKHKFASINTDPAWRKTGWTSWRLDTANVGNFQDKYVQSMQKQKAKEGGTNK